MTRLAGMPAWPKALKSIGRSANFCSQHQGTRGGRRRQGGRVW